MRIHLTNAEVNIFLFEAGDIAPSSTEYLEDLEESEGEYSASIGPPDFGLADESLIEALTLLGLVILRFKYL